MDKLPAAVHAKLSKALSGGKLPDFGEDGYDDLYNAFGELWGALGDEWSKPGTSPARRNIAALVEFWSAIPGDGVLVGVAINMPGVLPIAIDAATEMKLNAVRDGLRKVKSHVPEEVVALEDVDDRLEWYNSAKGKKHAARLEAIEEEIQADEAFGTELLLGVMKRVVAERGEFFRAR